MAQVYQQCGEVELGLSVTVTGTSYPASMSGGPSCQGRAAAEAGADWLALVSAYRLITTELEKQAIIEGHQALAQQRDLLDDELGPALQLELGPVLHDRAVDLQHLAQQAVALSQGLPPADTAPVALIGRRCPPLEKLEACLAAGRGVAPCCDEALAAIGERLKDVPAALLTPQGKEAVAAYQQPFPWDDPAERRRLAVAIHALLKRNVNSSEYLHAQPPVRQGPPPQGGAPCPGSQSPSQEASTEQSPMQEASTDERRLLTSLLILLAAPQGPRLIHTYATSPREAHTEAQALFRDSWLASRSLDRLLDNHPSHVWGFPPLLAAALRTRELDQIDGFPQFVYAYAQAQREETETAIAVTGGVLFFLSLLAPAFGPAGLVLLGAADFAYNSWVAGYRYLQALEQDLAFAAAEFAPEESKLAVAPGDYGPAALAALCAFVSAIGLYRGLISLASLPKPPTRPVQPPLAKTPPHRPRVNLDELGISDASRGISRGRLMDPEMTRFLTRPGPANQNIATPALPPNVTPIRPPAALEEAANALEETRALRATGTGPAAVTISGSKEVGAIKNQASKVTVASKGITKSAGATAAKGTETGVQSVADKGLPAVAVTKAWTPPPQIRGLHKIGQAFRTREEALQAIGKSSRHMAEITYKDVAGRIKNQWWEISESGLPGRAGDTEQKALMRVNLKRGETLEIRGTYPPCQGFRSHAGCFIVLEDEAIETEADILYFAVSRKGNMVVYTFAGGEGYIPK